MAVTLYAVEEGLHRKSRPSNAGKKGTSIPFGMPVEVEEVSTIRGQKWGKIQGEDAYILIRETGRGKTFFSEKKPLVTPINSRKHVFDWKVYNNALYLNAKKVTAVGANIGPLAFYGTGLIAGANSSDQDRQLDQMQRAGMKVVRFNILHREFMPDPSEMIIRVLLDKLAGRNMFAILTLADYSWPADWMYIGDTEYVNDGGGLKPEYYRNKHRIGHTMKMGIMPIAQRVIRHPAVMGVELGLNHRIEVETTDDCNAFVDYIYYMTHNLRRVAHGRILSLSMPSLGVIVPDGGKYYSWASRLVQCRLDAITFNHEMEDFENRKTDFKVIKDFHKATFVDNPGCMLPDQVVSIGSRWFEGGASLVIETGFNGVDKRLNSGMDNVTAMDVTAPSGYENFETKVLRWAYLATYYGRDGLR